MEIAIMQPYFLPYIGYFQLLNAVDEFVLYDNIKFTKKGWINRNRILNPNNSDELFSIALKKDSDSCFVNQRYISQDYEPEKLVRKIENNYKKAISFNEVMPVIEQIILNKKDNLFDYIYDSIKHICEYLDIKVPIVLSSSLGFDHNEFRSQDKVIRICEDRKATSYLNPIGGMELYDKEAFEACGIELQFHKVGNVFYPQFGQEFVPHLSIVDVLMFNRKDVVISFLEEYERL